MDETPSEQDSGDPSPARTPTGTTVGVDDPYEHVDRCDHCTDDGRCRFAFERFEADPTFARERRDDDYRCPVVHEADSDDGAGGDGDDRAGGDGDAVDWESWGECPNFAATTDGKECRRCGLEERRMAHSSERALIEEHHLSYAGTASESEDDSAEVNDGATSGDVRTGEDSPTGDALPTSAASGAPDVDLGPSFGDAFDRGGEEDAAAAVEDADHEITVALCRWCHAKVHKSWARIDDDVSPDPEAIAAREERRGREFEEASFQSAAERFERE